eukprot:jgi/Mesen1/9573/ME000065S08997
MAPIAACKPWKTTSNGAWSGDVPVHFSLPLLIVQLCLVLVISRVAALILRPLRQPRVIGEIIGGLILGPTVMGYIPGFTENIFPPASLPVLETIANIGLIYFLFMVGLELDLQAIKRTGKPALAIALAGVTLPFLMGIGAAYAFREILNVNSKFAPFLVFMGVAVSITAFPVLARILAERKLLTTDVGQMAMSAAAVNDVAAWILLALAVALSNTNSKAQIVVWILLSGIAFLIVMFFAVRPFMAFLVSKTVDNEPIPETLVAFTLVGVLIASFATDTIGIHGIFGGFVFGLIIPKNGAFGNAILEKIEDFVSIILLPLYFASSGLKTKLQSIDGAKSVGLVFLVIALACIGKIGGTVIASLCCKMPLRKSFVLGILMNTKGLVELIVLNIGLQKGILTQEIFSIMVLMALVTTFMTTPLVMWLYEPARDKTPYVKRKVEDSDDELRMVVCVHGMQNMPAMLNFTEFSRGSRKHPLKAFILHCIEFSERSSAIMMVTRVRKDGKPYWSKEAQRRGQDQVVVAFEQFGRLSKVHVQPMTVISSFFDMHDDICSTAAGKRANIIVLPFHRIPGADGNLDVVVGGFQQVNHKVLRHAPCSVAILVDRGLGGNRQMESSKVANNVAVLFFGGPDDREALSVARRMVEHPGVRLTVIRFVSQPGADVAFEVAEQMSAARGAGAPATGDTSEIQRSTSQPTISSSLSSFHIPIDKMEVDKEHGLDNLAVLSVAKMARQQQPAAAEQEASPNTLEAADSVVLSQIKYEVREVDDVASAVLQVAKEGEFDLLVIGRGRRPGPLIARMTLQMSSQHNRRSVDDGGAGLGALGQLLTERDNEVHASVLVVQQHDPSFVRVRASSRAELATVADEHTGTPHPH